MLFDLGDCRVRFYRQDFAALPTVDADCFRHLFTHMSPRSVVSLVWIIAGSYLGVLSAAAGVHKFAVHEAGRSVKGGFSLIACACVPVCLHHRLPAF